ncbi:MAG TPA: hypothetical protein VGD55_03365 [Acidothermaceae bacterium]
MTISPDDERRASSATVAPLVPFAPAARQALARASIITPGDWIELDLDPKTRHTSISRAVRQAVARSRSLAPDAVRLIGLLDRTSRKAAEAGAFYCASRVVEDATGGVLVATVLMQGLKATTPLPAVRPESASPQVGEQCASLAQVMSNDPAWAGANIRVVALAFIGPAVRVQIEKRGVVVQYVVPLVDGTVDVVLTFSCPCPPYARVMTELFDAMAQSLDLHFE